MRKPFLLAFAAVTLSFAQKAPLSKEEQILIRLEKIEEQNHRILETQDKIQKILEEADAPPAPPPPVKIDVSKSPFIGKESAPVTVVEFTDYQCPFCNKFHTETFPKLHDEYVATGKIKFVRRDLPLPATMHPNAQQAAEAGRCAGEQGHFWEMTDWMQSNPAKLSIEELRDHASELDLDLNQYRECMATGKYRAAVEADAKVAQDLHITGTPAFIIGKSGDVVTGNQLIGAQPLEAFEAAIASVK